MGDKNIIDFLFDKKDEDQLFLLEDTELKKLDNKITMVNNEISKFIEKRVHPKSRKKLRRLLRDYSNAIFVHVARENELYYKYGVSDGVKFITSSLSVK